MCVAERAQHVDVAVDLAWVLAGPFDRRATARAALAQQAHDRFVRDQTAATPDPEGPTAFFRTAVAVANGRNDEVIAQMQFADGNWMTRVRNPMGFIGRAPDLAGRAERAIV